MKRRFYLITLFSLSLVITFGSCRNKAETKEKDTNIIEIEKEDVLSNRVLTKEE